jgi:hypothetical protein
MRDFSECRPLRISAPQRSLELRFEDPVFGTQSVLSSTAETWYRRLLEFLRSTTHFREGQLAQGLGRRGFWQKTDFYCSKLNSSL